MNEKIIQVALNQILNLTEEQIKLYASIKREKIKAAPINLVLTSFLNLKNEIKFLKNLYEEGKINHGSF